MSEIISLPAQTLICIGTMSGGGNKPVQGRIGCRVVEKVDRKVVEKQEADLNYDIEKLEVSLKTFSRIFFYWLNY